jgi:hypothetical protein
MFRKLTAAILLIGTLLGQQAAVADSWMPAQVQTYLSKDAAIRIIITPRELEHALAYFNDKVEGREPAGQRREGNDKANVRLERRGADGKWSLVWQRELMNDVAPVEALVSKTGKFVVTFDNWHSTGYGENVVVIYGSNGQLVRSLQLSDFLPKELIDALPRTTSSLHWSGDHSITEDEQQLILKVRFPQNGLSRDDSRFFDIALNLSTGQPLPVTEETWRSVLAEAAAVNAAQQNADVQRREYLTKPLLGPASNDQTSWHEYLREAFARLTPDWREDSTSTTVLRLPTAKDYNPSKKWVREQLRDAYGDYVAFATLSQPNLVTVLRKEVAGFKPGRLNHLTIYLALEESYWNEAVRILKPTGAKLVQLDPTKPIPQNSERLKALVD